MGDLSKWKIACILKALIFLFPLVFRTYLYSQPGKRAPLFNNFSQLKVYWYHLILMTEKGKKKKKAKWLKCLKYYGNDVHIQFYNGINHVLHPSQHYAFKILICVICGLTNMLLFSHQVISSFLWARGLQPTRLLGPGDFPGKNAGVARRSLLQGIFQPQGSNPCLLHWQADSLPLSHLLITHLKSLSVQNDWHYLKKCATLPALE